MRLAEVKVNLDKRVIEGPATVELAKGETAVVVRVVDVALPAKAPAAS